MRRRTATATLIATTAAGLLTGCGVIAAATAPDTSRAGDCPPVSSGSGNAAVDYVDFVRAHDTMYLASFGGRPRLTAKDVGPVQFRVRCALSTLNDLTHKSPAPARNHDAAFLPPGTKVHAVKGWPVACRLTARHDGSWHLYVAQRTGGTVTPMPCPMHPPRDTVRP